MWVHAAPASTHTHTHTRAHHNSRVRATATVDGASARRGAVEGQLHRERREERDRQVVVDAEGLMQLRERCDECPKEDGVLALSTAGAHAHAKCQRGRGGAQRERGRERERRGRGRVLDQPASERVPAARAQRWLSQQRSRQRTSPGSPRATSCPPGRA